MDQWIKNKWRDVELQNWHSSWHQVRVLLLYGTKEEKIHLLYMDQ